MHKKFQRKNLVSSLTLQKHAHAIYSDFHGRKNDNFQLIFFFTIFIFLLKTYIMGTRKNRLIEVVLTSTHNICFRAKIKKIMYTPVNPSFTI